MVTDVELNEIEHLCLAAQPGDWQAYIEGIHHASGSDIVMTAIGGERGNDLEILGGTVDDLIFVAHARADILRLNAEIRALRRVLGRG